MSISSPRVLAAGINPPGQGNLSSYVGKELLEQGCDVTVLCRNSKKAIELQDQGFQTELVDFSDVGGMARSLRALGEFDAVINTIGSMGTNRLFGAHRNALYDANAKIPANLSAAMLLSGNMPRRSVHTGSLLEMPYKAATEVRGKKVYVTEDDAKDPTKSWYAKDKALGSLAWRDGFRQAYPGMDPVIAHLGMILGPNDPAAKEMVEGLGKMGVYPRLSYDADPTVPLIGADEAAAYMVHMLLNHDVHNGGHYFLANPNLSRTRQTQVVRAGEGYFYRKIQTLDFLRLIGVPLPHIILGAGVLRDSAITLFTGGSTMLDWSRVRELIANSPYFMIDMEANTLPTFPGLREIPARKLVEDYLQWYADENNGNPKK